jgi:hypothetical protein
VHSRQRATNDRLLENLNLTSGYANLRHPKTVQCCSKPCEPACLQPTMQHASAHHPSTGKKPPAFRSLRLKWDHREGQARRLDLLADHLLAG